MNKPTPFEMVAEFHTIFGHPISMWPHLPDEKRVKLRLDLILEEVRELIGACGGDDENSNFLKAAMYWIQAAREVIGITPVAEFNGSIAHIAKELTDVNYVVQGCALEFGFNLDNTTEEVHASNMSKLDEDGKPIYNEKGKVMKGPNYRLAELERVIFPQKAAS